MAYETLISPDEVVPQLNNPDWALVDCRFDLSDPNQGRDHYLVAHIPGAVYAHLDEDLSGPVIQGVTGRHPLPSPEIFGECLSGWGIDKSVQVVAYDDMNGVFAGRLWWMLRWLGHTAVAVLDGGFQRWQAEGLPVSTGNDTRARRSFEANVVHQMVAGVDDVMTSLDDATVQLLDARSTDRYRGENETLDPRAGHIPGARSAAYAGNLDERGRFLAPDLLRARYEQLLDGRPANQAIIYCGSGVSAAHDLLAMVHAGFDQSRLYVGSWSQWCSDPNRPMVTGGEGEES